MVISSFVLGIFAAIVAILIAVIIVIVKLEGHIEKVERNIADTDEALIREIDSRYNSVSRDLKDGLEGVIKDVFADSKSYTDSRIDKLTESIKK